MNNSLKKRKTILLALNDSLTLANEPVNIKPCHLLCPKKRHIRNLELAQSTRQANFCYCSNKIMRIKFSLQIRCVCSKTHLPIINCKR